MEKSASSHSKTKTNDLRYFRIWIKGILQLTKRTEPKLHLEHNKHEDRNRGMCKKRNIYGENAE